MSNRPMRPLSPFSQHKKPLALLGFPGAALFVAAAAEGGLPSISTLIVPIIVILILVVLNGFFVASEFAIIGIRPTQLEQKANQGDSLAANIQQVVESPVKQDRFIATAQLGITIASLGLGMYGEPAIAHFIEPYLARLTGADIHDAFITTIGYLVSLSLLTYLHIVIGEMIPKTLALSSPLQTVSAVFRPMSLFQTAMMPLVRGLNMIGAGMMRLLRVPPVQGNERVHSADEIEDIVAESAEEGLLDFGQETMIRKIFDFSERTVAQVMTPRRKVQAIDESWELEKVKEVVLKSHFSRLPVYHKDLDHVVGTLHLKDLIKFTMAENPPMTWRALLRQTPSVPENYKVEQLLAAFKQEKIHLAIVRDEFGGIAGIVTLEDLVEEVVGEVRDEFDQELEPFVVVSPGKVEMEGEYLVEDWVEYLDQFTDAPNNDELPDVSTVGGLVVTWLGRQPTAGDVVERQQTGIKYTVLQVDGLAISRLRAEFEADKEPPTLAEAEAH